MCQEIWYNCSMTNETPTKRREGRPDKWKSVKELKDAIDAYFSYADDHNEPYLITGLCLALDCSREVLLDWDKDTGKYPKPEQAVKLIKNAKLRCQNYAEKMLMNGKVNPTGAIFNLKNNYRWKDKSEVDATTNGKDLASTPIIINMPKQDKE